MAQITNYDSLVDKVVKYQDREGDTSFTDQVDTFIALAEASFNRTLKSREMATTTTLTTDASGYATLPADFIRARGLSTITGNLSQSLDVIAAPAVASLFPIDSAGIATYVSMTNGQIRIQPSAASSVVLEYDARFVGLSADNQTNWIIRKHPDLYLFATLAQSNVWLKSYDEAATLAGQAERISDEILGLYGMEMFNAAGITLEGTTP
jgi:hypothetical protein